MDTGLSFEGKGTIESIRSSSAVRRGFRNVPADGGFIFGEGILAGMTE